MRDINRIDEILNDIKNIWEKYPNLRLGQLICNVIRDPALYYIEDKELIEALKEFYGDVK